MRARRGETLSARSVLPIARPPPRRLEFCGAVPKDADGRDCAYLWDIVAPSHQGQGLGKEIVARLVRLASGHKKIILYAVPGKGAFYKSFGFRRMTPPWRSSKTPSKPTPTGTWVAPKATFALRRGRSRSICRSQDRILAG